MKNTYIILLLFTLYICVAFGTELDEGRGYTGTPATQGYQGGKAWCGACRRKPRRGPILLRRGTRPSGYRRTSIITWKKSYPKRRIYKVSTKNRSSGYLTKRKEEIRRRYRNSYRRSYPRRYRSYRRSYPRRYRSYRRRDSRRDDYYEDSRDDNDEDDSDEDESRDDSDEDYSRNDSDEDDSRDDSDEESQDEDEDLEEFYEVLKHNKQNQKAFEKQMQKWHEKHGGEFLENEALEESEKAPSATAGTGKNQNQPNGFKPTPGTIVKLP